MGANNVCYVTGVHVEALRVYGLLDFHNLDLDFQSLLISNLSHAMVLLIIRPVMSLLKKERDKTRTEQCHLEISYSS